MSYEVHADLFLEIERGCTEKRKSQIVSFLYKTYTPLIHSVAWGYPTLTHDQAFCAALQGLMDAIAKFDYHLGVDFAHVAKMYMRSACQKEYRDEHLIHIPHNRQHEYELACRKGILNKPTDELTEDEKRTLEGLADVIPVLQCNDLDAPISIGKEGEVTLGETKAQHTFDSPDQSYYMNEVTSSLARLLDKLPKKEKLALIHFEGLFGEEEKTARDIGKIIGMSHQGAIDASKRAKLKLKEFILEEEDIVDNYRLEGIK